MGFDARAVLGERSEGISRFIEGRRERLCPEQKRMVDKPGMEDDHRLTLPRGGAPVVQPSRAKQGFS
jgi:hypothetical protein